MTRCALTLSILVAAAAAHAQTSPQQVEPGVRTSTAAEPIPGSGPGAVTPPNSTAPIAVPVAPATTQLPGAVPARTDRAMDRVELENTQITGNRELPKVMYVVPWKKPDLGEFAGRPPRSLLDEVLTPVDRDVFRRQNRYFAALQPDAAGVAPVPAANGKDLTGASAPRTGDEK